MLNVSGFCDSEMNADSFLGNFSVLIKDKSVLKDFSNTFDFIKKIITYIPTNSISII